MKFWDSSAIVPLLVREETSRRALGWYRDDPAVLVWCLSSTEAISALQRRLREGGLSEPVLLAAQARLDLLRKDWLEVTAFRPVRERAERLLAVHPLKAADALQLGAALVATEESPKGVFFVSFDTNLNRAARREGFSTPT